MTEKDNHGVFAAFAERAAKKLEEKKVHKKCRLHIPSMDEDITVRGLSTAEIAEVLDVDNDNDPYASDKYSVYLAAVDPDLREVAKKLKEEGKIREYTEICEIFDAYEIKAIASKIMELSGVIGSKKVEVVTEDLKNS